MNDIILGTLLIRVFIIFINCVFIFIVIFQINNIRLASLSKKKNHLFFWLTSIYFLFLVALPISNTLPLSCVVLVGG